MPTYLSIQKAAKVTTAPFSIGAETDCAAGTFLITDACIECGACAAACPERCITAGPPYAIDQSHCLRCDICYEACPVKAVVRWRW